MALARMTENKKASKSICLILPSLSTGGMERVMSELANYLSSKSDVIVHLVLYGIKREIVYSIERKVVIHTPSFEFNNRYRGVSAIRTMFFIRKKIKEINPTTILSFGEYWNSFVLLSLFGLKFPVFISDRCQPNKTFGLPHDALRKWLYPFASGIIAQTEKARQIYQKKFPKSYINTIGNPIRKITPNNTIKRENIILTVGRLIRTKNHDKLIEIFGRVNEPKWKLVIVGGDAQKQKNMVRLKQLVQNLGLQDRVIFAGNTRDVETYYLKSKIFAFTSSSEGFPNVIGEAQSAGLPVIAFDCIAGPAEMVIDNKNGYLIPPDDYKRFEEELKRLMEDENLRNQFGTMGRKTIQKFNINSIGEKYYNILVGNEDTPN